LHKTLLYFEENVADFLIIGEKSFGGFLSYLVRMNFQTCSPDELINPSLASLSLNMIEIQQKRRNLKDGKGQDQY